MIGNTNIVLKIPLLVLFFFSCTLQTYTQTSLALFKNKRIVILGGTGYLGRALTTEILKHNPKHIIVYSRDEVKHFNFMKCFNNSTKINCVIGDIRDYNSVLKVTRSADIVLHVAALKRMDMLEANVEESIKTNILGSINVFHACVENNVQKVLFVSTDKACSPANTYGACKFISEKIFTNYNKQEISTQFVVARYGNVLESTGSLIPIVLDRIKNKEDILLTDPQMTRFIIDKKEAVQLIVDALTYGIGGEIFVKKLPAFKISDVIKTLKERFHADNRVVEIGIRPGEKIHETLINEDEIPRTITFKDCFIITPTITSKLNTGNQDVPCYLTKSQYLNPHTMKKFSSDQTVIPKKEVALLWEQLETITIKG